MHNRGDAGIQTTLQNRIEQCGDRQKAPYDVIDNTDLDAHSPRKPHDRIGLRSEANGSSGIADIGGAAAVTAAAVDEAEVEAEAEAEVFLETAVEEADAMKAEAEEAEEDEEAAEAEEAVEEAAEEVEEAAAEAEEAEVRVEGSSSRASRQSRK